MSNSLSKMSEQNQIQTFSSECASNASDVWKTIHSIIISKSVNTLKMLTLKHPSNDENFILADLRVFTSSSGRATRYGVCMTEFEYDYFTKVLLFARNCEQTLKNKSGARVLTISPKPSIGGVEVTQSVNDKIRKIALTGVDCSNIIENYGSIYNIIDEVTFQNLPKELVGSLECVPDSIPHTNAERFEINIQPDLDSGMDTTGTGLTKTPFGIDVSIPTYGEINSRVEPNKDETFITNI